MSWQNWCSVSQVAVARMTPQWHQPTKLEFPHLHCFYFPISTFAISTPIRWSKKGHIHIPTNGWAESRQTSSADSWSLWTQMRKSITSLLAITSSWNLALIQLWRQTLNSEFQQSLFFTNRNPRDFYKALEFLKKSQNCQLCLSLLQKESLVLRKICYWANKGACTQLDH